MLARGLVIDKVYVGYCFLGAPLAVAAVDDLQELFARTKADFDATVAEVRAAREAAQWQPAVA